MFKRIIVLLAGVWLCAVPAAAQQQPEVAVIRAAVLRVDDPGLPPISRLDLPPEDLAFAGARLAIEDNDTTGRFMNQDFEAEEIVDLLLDDEEVEAKLRQKRGERARAGKEAGEGAEKGPRMGEAKDAGKGKGGRSRKAGAGKKKRMVKMDAEEEQVEMVEAE